MLESVKGFLLESFVGGATRGRSAAAFEGWIVSADHMVRITDGKPRFQISHISGVSKQRGYQICIIAAKNNTRSGTNNKKKSCGRGRRETDR